jgi:hypothetical protein
MESALTIFGSASLSLALVWLARSWIAERLRAAIAHEYAEKLERHRADLASSNDAALERLRATNTRQLTELQHATETYRATHVEFHRKRIAAIEQLWRAVCCYQENIPEVLVYLDCLQDSEFSAIQQAPALRRHYESLTHERVHKWLWSGTDIDELRLLTGENLYALVFAFRAVVGRVAYMLIKSKENDESIPAVFDDPHLQRLLEEVLPKEELDKWRTLRVGKLGWIRAQIQTKYLHHARQILSGSESGDSAFAESHKIIELSDELLRQRRASALSTAPNVMCAESATNST